MDHGPGLEWPHYYEGLGDDVETMFETGGTVGLPTGVKCRVGTVVNGFNRLLFTDLRRASVERLACCLRSRPAADAIAIHCFESFVHGVDSGMVVLVVVGVLVRLVIGKRILNRSEERRGTLIHEEGDAREFDVT